MKKLEEEVTGLNTKKDELNERISELESGKKEDESFCFIFCVRKWNVNTAIRLIFNNKWYFLRAIP